MLYTADRGSRSENRLTFAFPALLAAATALLAAGCGGGGGTTPSGSGGKPGGTGGAAPTGSGGGSGGADSSSGGAPPGATGGMTSPASGGSGTGGATASGGAGGADNTAGRAGGAAGGRSAVGGRAAGGTTAQGGSAAGGAGVGGPPIIDLFNGTDLTGWTANREVAAAQAPGTVLTPAQAQVIFKVENGMIHVYGDAVDQSTQARHTLVTAASYTKYNLWVDYKWGTKKFAPYTNLTLYPRDAGVLFHLHGDKTQVWPSSIEFQIKEGTTGDIFALYARCTSLARNGGTVFVEAADGGTPKVVNGATGFIQHSRSASASSIELPDWNTIQLQVNGGTAVYIVNGQVVNRISSVNDRTGTTGVPVVAGPIALQAEHAEAFYRNVRIQVLP